MKSFFINFFFFHFFLLFSLLAKHGTAANKWTKEKKNIIPTWKYLSNVCFNVDSAFVSVYSSVRRGCKYARCLCSMYFKKEAKRKKERKKFVLKCVYQVNKRSHFVMEWLLEEHTIFFFFVFLQTKSQTLQKIVCLSVSRKRKQTDFLQLLRLAWVFRTLQGTHSIFCFL